ncbi:MAG: GIY-YIG nuclease family protein [Patescibacteria group bacterium]
MYTVYILQNSEGKLYKGFTNNLNRRLQEHKRGKTKTTSRMRKIKLIYQEEYDNFDGARKRELYLKTAAGRRFLKTKISLQKSSKAGA